MYDQNTSEKEKRVKIYNTTSTELHNRQLSLCTRLYHEKALTNYNRAYSSYVVKNDRLCGNR